MESVLNTSIEFLKGVGPQRANLLKSELGIFTFGDLLNYFPFRYVDRSQFLKLNQLIDQEAHVQVRGKIKEAKIVGKGRGQRLHAELIDDTGSIELVWFQGARFIKPQLELGKEFIVFGKPNNFNNKISITHPELTSPQEALLTVNSTLQPVYHSGEKLSSRGLNSRGVEKIMQSLFAKIKNDIPENISKPTREKYKLINRGQAFFNVHFPTGDEELKNARYRLKFEELFFLQLFILRQKLGRSLQSSGHIFEVVASHFNDFYNDKLPFELTGAQKKVIKQIRKDCATGKQMNRLLQGDVGSGKTIVALLNILIAIDNGFQAALMAPTEILATQHFNGLSQLLEGTSTNVAILTGSTKQKARRFLHEQLENQEIDILIGTHALIEDKVKFKNLGFVVIDEQHRFGVEQRAKLWRKNNPPPHILVMTATPIPRTLAMTVYGDLDVSVIDELPPGRKTIKTEHCFDSARLRIFGFMKKQIDLGRQVYLVYPLIQESETLDYKDLMDGYESITRAFPIPKYQVSIVHGKMKAADKEFEMQRFKKGETHILVATTVIEVGVDVPNATTMVIESAERFGLSQLHQLRGRVGRGGEQSYCVLMTGNKLSNEAKLRMSTMVRTNNGFEIADTDLKLRGPGDMMGTRQSGILEFKIADLTKDQQILLYARTAASDLLKEDPNFQKHENLLTGQSFKVYMRKKSTWSKIS